METTTPTPKPVLKRTSISVPEDLLTEFDEASWQRGYVDRSEAVRQAMRMAIAEWRKGRR